MESRGAAPSASHPDSTPTGRRFSFGDRRKTYLTFPDTLYSRYKVLSVLSRPLFHLLHSPAVRRARMVRPIVPANILFTVPTKTVIEHQIFHIQKDRRILDPGLPALSSAPAFSPPPFWVTLFSCCLIGQMIFFQQMKNQTQSHADHTGQNHSCQFYISDL